jgi:hypothetical protein
MQAHPTIKSVVKSFTVTILGSIVPVVNNQIYTLGSDPLIVQFDSFQTIPSNFNVGSSIIEAFVFTGSVLLSPIDLKCACLTSVNDLEWIQIDSAAGIITIQTSNRNYIGFHKIVLV